MKCAVVELKYVPKKFFIVRTDWIKNFKGKYSPFEAVLCFISTDLFDELNFLGKYSETYDGANGLYKVFIRTITEKAIEYQKSKRVTSVPKKYRVPQNTDSELNKEEKRQKLNEKRMQKLCKDNAANKNASHLVDLVKSKHISSEIGNSESDSDSAEKEPNQLKIVDQNKNDENPLPVSATTATKPINVAFDDTKKKFTSSPSPCNQNVLITKEHNLPIRGTSTKISHSKVIQAAKEMLPPSSIIINKNQKNLPVKQKDPSASTVTTSGEQSRKIELHGTVIKKFSASLSHNKNPQNQPVFLDAKQKGSSQSILVTEACSSSSTIIRKNTKNQNKGSQNATKTYRNDTVAPDVARKISTKSSTAEGSRKRIMHLPEKIAAKKQKVVTADQRSVPNDAELASQRNIIKALKHENDHLKIINESLTEKTEALLKALVVCTKSLPKPLSFEEKDGGRLYDCGIFFDQDQCRILDAITDHREFCNSLTVAVFGFDVLIKSSVTGKVSNRTKGPAKPPLDKIGLKFIYDTMAIRTNNCILFYPSEIRKIIAKKIANLLAAENSEPPPESKHAAINTDCDEDEDCVDESGEEEIEEDGDVPNGDENIQIDQNEKESDEYNFDYNGESSDVEHFEKDNEVTINSEENTQVDGNEGEQYEADEAIGKGNEHVNGLGDPIQSDMTSTGDIRMINDADGSYYVLDMPVLEYDLLYGL